MIPLLSNSSWQNNPLINQLTPLPPYPHFRYIPPSIQTAPTVHIRLLLRQNGRSLRVIFTPWSVSYLFFPGQYLISSSLVSILSLLPWLLSYLFITSLAFISAYLDSIYFTCGYLPLPHPPLPHPPLP